MIGFDFCSAFCLLLLVSTNACLYEHPCVCVCAGIGSRSCKWQCWIENSSSSKSITWISCCSSSLRETEIKIKSTNFELIASLNRIYTSLPIDAIKYVLQKWKTEKVKRNLLRCVVFNHRVRERENRRKLFKKRKRDQIYSLAQTHTHTTNRLTNHIGLIFPLHYPRLE